MPLNSRAKGKAGELEISANLRQRGYTAARRGQQFSGCNGDADVVGLPGLHLEIKRTEAPRLRVALAQAQQDSAEGELPVVLQRGNRQPWVAFLDLDDFLTIYAGWAAHEALVEVQDILGQCGDGSCLSPGGDSGQ